MPKTKKTPRQQSLAAAQSRFLARWLPDGFDISSPSSAMRDRILTREAAQTLHDKNSRTMLAWFILQTADGVVARLVVHGWGVAAGILTAPTLVELRAQLPAGLTHWPRQADDEPDVVEMWYRPEA